MNKPVLPPPDLALIDTMQEGAEPSDAEVYAKVYGLTVEQIEFIARETRLSPRKVHRVVELAHSLRPEE